MDIREELVRIERLLGETHEREIGRAQSAALKVLNEKDEESVKDAFKAVGFAQGVSYARKLFSEMRAKMERETSLAVFSTSKIDN